MFDAPQYLCSLDMPKPLYDICFVTQERKIYFAAFEVFTVAFSDSNTELTQVIEESLFLRTQRCPYVWPSASRPYPGKWPFTGALLCPSIPYVFQQSPA